MSRGTPPITTGSKAVAGLTARRRRRGLPVGSEGFDIEQSLGEDICACGRLSVKGARCTCGRTVGRIQ